MRSHSHCTTFLGNLSGFVFTNVNYCFKFSISKINVQKGNAFRKYKEKYTVSNKTMVKK